MGFATLLGAVPKSVAQGGWVLALAFFGTLACVLLAIELGRWLGARQRAAGQTASDPGVGPLDGAVFGLFTLMLAFVFFGAAARLDRRRELIVSAATAIETAYRRIDFVPSDLQPNLRALYRRYVESMLELARNPSTLDAALEGYRQITEVEDQIWKASVAAAERNPSGAGFVISSVSDMISLTRIRFAVANTHTPGLIFVLLFGLALLSAVLAGRNMATTQQPNRLNKLIFGTVVALAMYTIVDFEFPRLGLIRIDVADELLVRLLAWMK